MVLASPNKTEGKDLALLDPLTTVNSMSQTELTRLKIESLENELELKNQALEKVTQKFQALSELRSTEAEKLYQDFKHIAEERFQFSERCRLDAEKENRELKEKLTGSVNRDQSDELVYINDFFTTLTGLSVSIADDGLIHCNFAVEGEEGYEDFDFILTPGEIVNQNRRESTSRRDTLSMASPCFDYKPVRVPSSLEESMGSEMQFEQSESRWFFKQLIEGVYNTDRDMK